ncbi:MAG: hypothetical protein MZW92_12005 [Comamonadaceae bacterium]|nr:hypothetical protein [Comamonadaceae bacterium]
MTAVVDADGRVVGHLHRRRPAPHARDARATSAALQRRRRDDAQPAHDRARRGSPPRPREVMERAPRSGRAARRRRRRRGSSARCTCDDLLRAGVI